MQHLRTETAGGTLLNCDQYLEFFGQQLYQVAVARLGEARISNCGR